ncbi:hypothetical protein [Rhodopseudomonas pseudopalustris]|uniref:Uncharacterized protein n=1 Tax=Rhodopseudomonas pseudopalustris TaxID=1513892 RepID=A0A1H8XDP9_9BRAD|nr:hypothetical protein [Rhodopseudomonas pseudopalustris]SEP37932.1 hypothetical protein SAMN05444123_12117 [Rhodopseudomonas pseudopalustris]
MIEWKSVVMIALITTLLAAVRLAQGEAPRKRSGQRGAQANQT